MIKLSVVIITFNEEKNIKRCIDSILDISDEIIVLDSFSTDKTKQICNSYNKIKFYQHSFDNFVLQKNRVIEYSSYDYILSLDADEAIDNKLKNEIIRIKTNPTYDAYFFNRLTNYCGKWIKHSGWYPDKQLRIWNKNKGKWGGVKIHEKVEMERDSTTSHITGDLLHYSFYTIEDHINIINKYSSLKARVMYEKGKKINLAKIFFKPLLKFIINYIIKKGFIDGYYGYIICRNSAFSDYLKYIKLRELYKNGK